MHHRNETVSFLREEWCKLRALGTLSSEHCGTVLVLVRNEGRKRPELPSWPFEVLPSFPFRLRFAASEARYYVLEYQLYGTVDGT